MIKRSFDIDLPMDVKEFNFFKGNVMNVNNRENNDVVTSFLFKLPLEKEYWTECVKIELEGVIVEVRNFTFQGLEEDIFLKFSGGLSLGVNLKGLEKLPVSAFLDNRGIYPCWVAEVIFHTKVGNFLDATHPSGIKCIATEEERILGENSLNKDKLLALKAWNAASKRLGKDFLLKYDDVSAFMRAFFDKVTKVILEWG